MARVTSKQLEALRKAAACIDHMQARAFIEEANVDDSTTFRTPEEKKTALAARLASYSPDDFGRYGKITEAQLRIERSNALNRSIGWAEIRARSQNKADAIFMLGNNTHRIRIEVKSGAGDGFTVKSADKEAAMAQFGKSNLLIVWATEYFTIVLTASELLDKLNEYSAGAGSFFKNPKAKDGAYNLPIQEWKTSKRKIAFLEQIAEESYDYDELVYHSRLVKRAGD